MGNLLSCWRWWKTCPRSHPTTITTELVTGLGGNSRQVRLETVPAPTPVRAKTRPRLTLNVDNSDPLSDLVPQTTTHTQDIGEHFPHAWERIGKGSMATVFRTIHGITGDTVAIKQIDYTRSGDTVLDAHFRRKVCRQIDTEVNCLSQLSHPNLLRVVGVYRNYRYLFLVTDYLVGGDLQHCLTVYPTLPEKTVQHLIRQLLTAVQHLHAHGVTHRDLKLENLLLTHADPDQATLQVCDLGICTKLPPPYRELVGTVSYLAPEVLDGCYDQSCDLWSVGVIMYVLATGCFPFAGHTHLETMDAIRSAQWNPQNSQCAHLSRSARHLLGRLLTPEPTHRITATEALGVSWFNTPLATGSIPRE